MLHGVGASAWSNATSQQVHDRLRVLAGDRFAVGSTTQMTEREAKHLIDEVQAMIPPPPYVAPRTTSFLKLPKGDRQEAELGESRRAAGRAARARGPVVPGDGIPCRLPDQPSRPAEGRAGDRSAADG
jgi:hypothetical protein